eukprot:gene67655-92666_t
MKRGQAKGVFFVSSDRKGSGRVMLSARSAERGTVTSDNLPPQKARILLRLALTQTTDPKEIQPFNVQRSAFCAIVVAATTIAQEIPTYAPPPPAPADPSKLPTVVLMSMGGTIASRGTPRLNVANYGGKGVPRVDPQDWFNDEPELATIANIRLEDGRPPVDRASGETQGDDLRVAARLR